MTPETDLMLLLESAEDALPMGRPEDFRWHADRPGESTTVDAFREFERNGWVRLDESRIPPMVGPSSGRGSLQPGTTESPN